MAGTEPVPQRRILGIKTLIRVEPLRLETGRKPALKLRTGSEFMHDQLQRKSLLPVLTIETRVLDRIPGGCL